MPGTNKFSALFAVAAAVLSASAETVVDVVGAGAEKMRVSVGSGMPAAFKKTLERNLHLSGAFTLVPDGAPASVKVAGGGFGSPVAATGRGRRISFTPNAADDKSARMDARRFADAICETFAGQKGFACDKIAFVRKNGRSEELCTGYADGADIRQVTQKGKAVVGPRWKDANTILYTGYLNNVPQVIEFDAASEKNRVKWGFGGLTAGATVSPDGRTAALILSKPFGNPELCTIDMASGTWKRVTTSRANEGQPAWSPDGRSIAYVSDETRRQHLFVVDPATKAKRRITSSGTQNVDPDWGADGSIAYATKRNGQSQIAVISAADGDKSAKLVTEPGSWQHPSWSRNRRHLVAERDGALFLVDTADPASKPIRLFTLEGKCTMPSWYSKGGAR